MAKKKSVKKKPESKKAPKFKVSSYELIRDVKIGDKLHKKGEKVELTDKGAEFFKSKYYIK